MSCKHHYGEDITNGHAIPCFVYDSNEQNISDESGPMMQNGMGQQEKTKLRISVSTMSNASGFAAFFFVQRNCPQRLSVFFSYNIHCIHELVDKLQIEVVYIIAKIMSNISINTEA